MVVADYKIAVLPGDGIGQEVTAQAQAVLEAAGVEYRDVGREEGIILPVRKAVHLNRAGFIIANGLSDGML